MVVEKATGEMERHMCPAELVAKVTDRLVGFLFACGGEQENFGCQLSMIEIR